MYSQSYLDEVQKYDPVLAAQLKAGNVPPHRPVWNQNNLTETRDLSENESLKLELWIQGR
jgi:hypothetical protein